MPTNATFKLHSKNKNVFLRLSRGHFATSHSHINYYIDVTTQKTRLSEAKAVAKELVSYYSMDTVVDTILCLDGTEVIGACLANELTKGDFINMNAHRTIYVVSPEHTTGSQLLFRDNLTPMIAGKNVLILAASVTTGYTALAAIEAINYYGGKVSGVAAIFTLKEECGGYPVRAAFYLKDLPDYMSHPATECPLCQQGQKVDALVNSYGYSKL
jgi:orotate phosphoribosyltransferase